MGGFDSTDQDLVEAALAWDPELDNELRPLLDGRFGSSELVLVSLAARLRRGAEPRAALLPVLADALAAALTTPPDGPGVAYTYIDPARRAA